MMRAPTLPMLATLALATLALPTLALPTPASAETVKLAYIDPLSGSLAATGQLGEQHFRFAIDAINARQGAGAGRDRRRTPPEKTRGPELPRQNPWSRRADCAAEACSCRPPQPGRR